MKPSFAQRNAHAKHWGRNPLPKKLHQPSQQPFSCVLGHFWHGDKRTNEKMNKQPGDPRASLLLTGVRGQSFAIGLYFPTVSTSVPPSPLIMPTTGGQVVAPTSANQHPRYILSYLMPTTGGQVVILPLQAILDSRSAICWILLLQLDGAVHTFTVRSVGSFVFVPNHICSQLILKIIRVASLYAGLHYIDVRRNSTESMNRVMAIAW